MYSVVLVSSGKHVTDSFNSMTLWENQKFHLKLVTTDLEEALKEAPDVLIYPFNTDGLKGCELSRKLFLEKSKTKVVLYGRKSFDSVKSAIDSRAWGYLSMPLELNDFFSLFIHLNQYLDLEANSSPAPALDVEQLKEEFFIRLLSGAFHEKRDALKEFDLLSLGVSTKDSLCSVIKFTINNFSSFLNTKWKYGKDALYVAVNNFIVKNRPDIIWLPIGIKDNEIYIAVFTLTVEELSGKYNNILKDLRDIMGLELSFSIIKFYQSFEDIFNDGEIDFLSDNISVIRDETHHLDVSNEDAISLAQKYIVSNFNKEICLDDVARYVDLSTAYFSRLFKQRTGENFIDYLIKIRMERSKVLLHNTKLKTYQVGEQVGYINSKYFCKLFKNYTGYTPTEYRSKVKR